MIWYLCIGSGCRVLKNGNVNTHVINILLGFILYHRIMCFLFAIVCLCLR